MDAVHHYQIYNFHPKIGHLLNFGVLNGILYVFKVLPHTLRPSSIKCIYIYNIYFFAKA